MKLKCKTCYKDFEGEEWMNQCRECYHNFRGKPRIWLRQDNRGVIILSHPSCTKDEIDEWIKKRFGSVNDPSNWGAIEITGKNAKVWWNCQDED